MAGSMVLELKRRKVGLVQWEHRGGRSGLQHFPLVVSVAKHGKTAAKAVNSLPDVRCHPLQLLGMHDKRRAGTSAEQGSAVQLREAGAQHGAQTGSGTSWTAKHW